MNRDWMPLVAGVLEIISGVCAWIGSAALLFSSAMVVSVPDVRNDPDVPFELITGLLTVLAVAAFLFGLVALVGGIAAIRRRSWLWALAGSIAALFTLTPAGLFALVLVILGEKEFLGRRAVSQAAAGEGAATRV